jgi:DNA-binding transcriptional ArsR family regulator
MKIKDKILAALKKNGDLSVKEMTELLDVSKQAIHAALIQLSDAGLIKKLGRSPKTIYKIETATAAETFSAGDFDKAQLQYLEKNFLVITEVGGMLEGIEGFANWCQKRKLPLTKTVQEYFITKKKYQDYYETSGLINGMPKLAGTKEYRHINLDAIYYLDFYAIERFGKTRLGTILHYAKQGQNKFLMKLLVQEIKDRMLAFIKQEKFDAIGFVPPTIRREVQLMKYLDTHLKINLPRLKIQKISGIIPVPQKSLNKMDERINNAENTFTINETSQYRHVLLLDDAVGSGATLNQIAGKIKQKNVAQKVTGLAIVGSFKGFDVITDV